MLTGTTAGFFFSIVGRMVGSFDGVIDDVRLWNRALSLDEIRASLFCPPGGDEAAGQERRKLAFEAGLDGMFVTYGNTEVEGEEILDTGVSGFRILGRIGLSIPLRSRP